VRRGGGRLGDYLRAASELSGEDPARRQAIAALLGFDLRSAAPPPPPRPLRDEEPEDTPPVEPPAETRPPARSEAEAAPPAMLEGGGEDAWLEPLKPAEVRVPGWMEAADPYPEPSGAPAAAPAPPEPLFVPAWSRALLRGLLAGRDPHGAVDVERLVDMLAAGRVLSRLPRLPRTHLGPAAQVLVDAGPSMTPFVDDQLVLLGELRRLVPMLQELVFETSPLRGTGPADAWPLPAYRPPPRGTPVLVVSDLGAARGSGTRRAPEAEWLAFAARVRRAQCPLVALVPFPPSRVRPALRRAMQVVTWDRATTTGRIHAVRRGAAGGA
jgi:hypothetical protein